MARELDRLSIRLERAKISEYVDLLNRPMSLIWRNLVAGMARGVGIAIGFMVGILPGLGGAVTLALMLPFIYDMEPVQAFAFLLGMWVVTATTGDITSVLLGVPGEATSAAAVLDGYPLTKRGEAGRALRQEKFSIEATTAAVAALYEELWRARQ